MPFAVTPDDSANLTNVTRVLYVCAADYRVLLMIWAGFGLSAIGAQAGVGGAIAPPPVIPEPVPDPNPDPDPTPDPGPTLATLPVTPATRWHPEFSQVTVQDGRVTAATDLQGLAGTTSAGTGLGPQALSNRQGRAF